ncbi:hypothetical protein [Zobellia alginiliquefaciens]|uniref:hypothetical protein n=1 Tax=Zobellia alginiliquefaciens TaxID=3032586 RepID=UPI0023E397A0|nr:hypothetical protein [Zobellia alginiliquefaciens]
MRIRYTLSFLFILSINLIQSQQPDTFGEVSTEELEMTTYSKDTTASAVVLYERGDNYFKVIDDRIRIVKEYHIKIKILNERGFDQADISIPLRKTEKNNEKLEELKAITHNGNNRFQVLSKDIYTKDVHEFRTERTFAFPNVKKGSVLEYKYKLISPYIYNFKGWTFQSDIPKIYSEFNAKIPGNYVYNRAMIGELKLDVNEADVKNNCFHIEGYRSASCEVLKYAMNDIPAFEIAEEFMLAPSNYISRIDFELSEFTDFSGFTNQYTKTWKDVDKEFKSDKDIGRQLTKKGFFEKHVPETLLNEPNELKRAKNIYAFVQKHYTWNEEYGIYGKARVKDAFDIGRGNVSEINLSLINLLNAADLKANLMLISTRKSGLPKMSHPVMSDFNYCIAKLDIDGETYLLDATNKYMAFGMLPYRALNYYGRVMDFKKDSYWYEITPKNNNKHQVRIQLNFDVESKKAIGKFAISNTGYNALITRKEIDSYRHEEDYLKYIEKAVSGDFMITSYERQEELQSDTSTSERLEFEIPNILNGDMVYFNPFLVRFFSENPFLLEKRTYPVDFGYTRIYKYLMVISVPDGYAVHELPESKTVKLDNGLVEMKFQTQANEKHISILFNLSLNSTHIAAEEYKNLKTVFRHVTDVQNNSLLILKKI